MIIKKCILTGAMSVILPGSPAQLLIAILIVFIDLLLTMKLEPYQDTTDDLLAFVTSFQMVITLLLALTKCVFDSSSPQEGDSANLDGPMGIVMTLLNMLAFFAFIISVLVLHPKVRRCIEKRTSESTKKESTSGHTSTKVAPKGERMAHNEDVRESNGENELSKLRSWGGR